MARVLVTGASGFVGSVLCPVLAQAGYAVRAALRSSRAAPAGVTDSVVVGDIGDHTDWTEALRNVDLVIHLAARAHIVNARTARTDLYAQINAHGTRRLAAESASQGIRRLVYLSTVKVNGEESGGRPYSAEDVPRPLDAYGTSKWLGEQALWQIAAGTAI